MGMHQIRFPVLTVRETVQAARIDDVREAAIAEVAHLAEDLKGPDDDVRPFLLLGNREGVHSLTPTFPDEVSLSFDDQFAMFVEQIGPMVLTQKDATCAALVLTVWTAVKNAEGSGPRAREHPDRQEAMAIMLADARGAQQTMIATIKRHRFKPPTVEEFRTVSDRVQPAIAEAFKRGFLGEG